MRIGHGYDVHRLVSSRKLILGGVEIPHYLGLLGHSDADVVTHALMDALLGAAALGDIGTHFPDSDPAYAGASSLTLLGRVMERMPAKKLSRSDAGWEVELMPGLNIQLLLWVGDDEFPPNAQMLFSDNFRYAFTAEDMANIGDIVLNRMKKIGASLA